MIEVKDITYSYLPGQEVLRDFSLTIQGGGIYGLLGKNGTGKSTLLYLMSGLLRPRKGQVVIDGMSSADRQPELLGQLFLVPEEYELPAISLQAYVQSFKPLYPHFDQALLMRCLQLFEMDPQCHLGALSMGQKKKVYMSVAIASGTRYLLMDEPTNGLDILSKSQFRKVLIEGMTPDKTIIVSTHQVHDVEHILDHVIIADTGRVLLDRPLVEDDGPIDLEQLFIDTLSGKVSSEDLQIKGSDPSVCKKPAQSESKPSAWSINWKRLLGVAKWDLAIQRKFYTRTALIILLVMAIPTLKVLFTYSAFPSAGFGPDAEAFVAETADDTWHHLILLLPLILGYTLHGFVTRSGRLHEMTLPATNLEKFLWHTLCTLGGTLLMGLISFILLDLIQMTYATATWGLDYVHSYWTATAPDTFTLQGFVRTSLEAPGMEETLQHDMLHLFPWIKAIGYIALCSTFVLGNAWKYKNNLALTIGCHVLIVIAVSLCTLFSLAALSTGSGIWFGRWFAEDMLGFITTMCLFTLITAGCWWLSYRLYCRAQLTTSRNR